MNKQCTKCKEVKDFTEFRKNKTKKDGHHHVCKQCMNAYWKKDYQENTEKYAGRNKARRDGWRTFFVSIKEGKECGECGETHPATLDYHHIDPTEKEFRVSKMWTQALNEKNKQKVLDEILKCVVLCANCHRKLHWNYENY